MASIVYTDNGETNFGVQPSEFIVERVYYDDTQFTNNSTSVIPGLNVQATYHGGGFSVSEFDSQTDVDEWRRNEIGNQGISFSYLTGGAPWQQIYYNEISAQPKGIEIKSRRDGVNEFLDSQIILTSTPNASGDRKKYSISVDYNGNLTTTEFPQ